MAPPFWGAGVASMTMFPGRPGGRFAVVPLIAVLIVVLCWAFGTAKFAGPDEPAHVIRSAALIRGDFRGVLGSDPGDGFVDVPSWVGVPDPACFAQSPYTPASCTDEAGFAAATSTNAGSYPVWGHLLASLGTLGPSSLGPWLPRVLSAAAPILLLVASLVAAARAGGLRAVGPLTAMTPMAWFTFGVVNPSSLVIAGGVALATAAPEVRTGRRWVGWLAVAGWSAMALPRRDGLVWASIGLAVVLVGLAIEPWRWLRSFSRAQLTVGGLATAWTIVSGLRGGAGAMRFVVLAPLGLIATVVVAEQWRTRVRTTGQRVALIVALAAVAVGGYALLVSERSTGFDRYYVRLIIHRTGENLTEAIGVMGWLDTPVPTSMVLLWAVVFGLLLSVAIQAGESRIVWSACAVVVSAVVAAWVIESVHDAYSGTYWQGRYYLPLLVFAPILAARAGSGGAADERIGRAVAGGFFVVLNVSFAAAMRRWGVGLAGSMLPTDWDTYGTPLPPVLLLGLHAVGSGLLAAWCVSPGRFVRSPTAGR